MIRKYIWEVVSNWVVWLGGIGSILFTLSNTYILTTPMYLQILFIVIAVACFVIASYQIWKKEHLEVIQLQKRLKPKVEIILKNSAKYYDSSLIDNGIEKLLRLCVTNISESTVENLEAKLTIYEGEDRLLESEPIEILGHPNQSIFNLNPEGEQFINIAMKLPNETRTKFCVLPPPGQLTTLGGTRFVLKIIVTGKDLPAVIKRYALHHDNRDFKLVKIKDTPKSTSL